MAWNSAGPYVTPPPFWTNCAYGMPPNPNVWFSPYQQPFPPLPHPPPPLPPPAFFEPGWSNVSQANWRESEPFRGQSRGGRWNSGHKRTRGGANDRGVSVSQGINPSSTQEADFNCCGKGYKTSSAYQSHLSTHKKCDVCEYTGSGKALKDHALLAHYIPDELKFDSPEDIQKWKEARKRNYPTAANVTKKQKLTSGKRNIGSVAETPLYRYINHIVNNDRGGRRGGGRGSRRPFAQRGGRQWRGRGTGVVQRGHNCVQTDDITADEDEDTKPLPSLPHAPATSVDNDGCMTEGYKGESGVYSGHQVEAQGPSCSAQQQQEVHTCTGRKKNSRVREKSKRQDRTRETFKKPTLLEKLLAAEIRKEQNAILQCIRYIVKKDFLRPKQSLDKSD